MLESISPAVFEMVSLKVTSTAIVVNLVKTGVMLTVVICGPAVSNVTVVALDAVEVAWLVDWVTEKLQAPAAGKPSTNVQVAVELGTLRT